MTIFQFFRIYLLAGFVIAFVLSIMLSTREQKIKHLNVGEKE